MAARATRQFPRAGRPFPPRGGDLATWGLGDLGGPGLVRAAPQGFARGVTGASLAPGRDKARPSPPGRERIPAAARGRFSNGWKKGGGFFQWLEKMAGIFPTVGKTAWQAAGAGVAWEEWGNGTEKEAWT